MKNSATRIPENCWVAVCGGQQVVLLRNRGDDGSPNLVTLWASSNCGKLTHELGAGKPGRVMQRFGVARSALEQTDLHQKAETDLLKEMMNRLARAVRLKETSKIILIAPATALGWIREHMPRAVQHAVIDELSKDLTHCSVEDIQRHLVA